MRPLLGIFRAWLNLRSTVPLRLFMHLWMILQEVPKPKMMLWESYRKSMLEKLAAKVGCSCCPSSCPAGRILRLFGQSIHQLLARWDFHFQTLEKHCEVPWSFLSGKALWQESELPALPAVLWCLGLRILDRLWTFIGFFFLSRNWTLKLFAQSHGTWTGADYAFSGQVAEAQPLNEEAAPEVPKFWRNGMKWWNGWFRLWTLQFQSEIQVWHVLSALRQTLSTASMPLKKHTYGACQETKFEAVKRTYRGINSRLLNDVLTYIYTIYIHMSMCTSIIILLHIYHWWCFNVPNILGMVTTLNLFISLELSDIWCLRRFGELVRWGQTLHWLSLW